LHDIFFVATGGRATEPIGLAIAAIMMLVVGTIDDVREVSAPAKTAGTVLCASVLFFAGISLLYFRFPVLGVFYLDPNWSYLLSVIWVFGMTPAVNFIDGLDGLAAGIVAIAAGRSSSTRCSSATRASSRAPTWRRSSPSSCSGCA